jgi:integrase
LGRLKAALEHACQDGRLAANPAAYVRPPRQAKRPRTTWAADELRAFLAEAGAGRLPGCWQMSARGLRRGEVLGLQWSDVDHDAGTVTVGRARVLVAGRVIVKSPKSERGYRTLPLDGELAAALRAQHARQAAERLEAGGAYDTTGPGWVAVDELCKPLHPEFYGDEFRRLCATAGVPVIRLQDVRHTANSLMAAAGIPDHVRAAWCGHTVAVNVATYTHARPEDLAAAGKALANVLGGV